MSAMSEPLFQVRNVHDASCGEPPTITNEANKKYCGYFQNRFGEQWVFIYDPETKVGELRGGDIGWDTVVPVRDGKVDVMLGKAESGWLLACWIAVTGTG
jgi:hypothetical protein